MIVNESIKAAEVHLFGLDGEDLGIVTKEEALKLAKASKVDLVCTSLLTSPPPCRLIGKGKAKDQELASRERKAKVKELRLTPQIEEHDLETKRLQAERLLKQGDSVLLTVKLTNSKQGAEAKGLVESLLRELKPFGKPLTGIQVSGKQVSVQVDPI
ncbi:translation initiation factor IF-3 [Gorillibacterium sp. CAU 1737]|uniref:translation initiation factor IF-3 n=1 Tax=Gorillibacterium sp. CAU 1737 TaxID=3140362 RepID=UPI0032601CA0